MLIRMLRVSGENRCTAGAQALIFLAALQLMALSFVFHELYLLSPQGGWFIAAVTSYGLGALILIIFAPLFYHAALRRSISRIRRYLYAVTDLLILCLTLGLFWERYRGLGVIILSVLAFFVLLYGVLFGVISYRNLNDLRLRRGVILFSLLVLAFLLPLYRAPSLATLAPFVREHWYDGIGFPLFTAGISLLLLRHSMRGDAGRSDR